MSCSHGSALCLSVCLSLSHSHSLSLTHTHTHNLSLSQKNGVKPQGKVPPPENEEVKGENKEVKVDTITSREGAREETEAGGGQSAGIKEEV